MQLTAAEAKSFVDGLGPFLGCDHTFNPVFPDGREDVCVVRRSVEDGRSTGFDILYLLWKREDGTIQWQEVASSRGTKDYVHINAVVMDGERVTISYGSGGTFSGMPWTKKAKKEIK